MGFPYGGDWFTLSSIGSGRAFGGRTHRWETALVVLAIAFLVGLGIWVSH